MPGARLPHAIAQSGPLRQPKDWRAALALTLFAATAMAAHSAEPWSDKSLSPDARAEALVRAMTLDEKIHLLHGPVGFELDGKPPPPATNLGVGFVAALPRLGIPALQLIDGPVGVTNLARRANGRSTAFPSTQTLAASFDPELANEVGKIMGGEARDQGFNVLLAGGVGIERDAWNGRNFEYLGEDPILAGRIVSAQVRGIQSQGVVSTIKHFVINTSETDRTWVNMVADERSLREIDLLPFEIAVKESGVGSVMCAYNKVNGTYACENAHLLNDILKKDWGFKGWVISDWGATHSTAKAANAGLDQEFDKEIYFAGALKTAVEKGEVSEARIDDMARRILRSLAATGALDRAENIKPIDSNAGLAIAQRVAESGIVLLQNRNELLPLRADALKKIAVIGRRADIGVLSGGGSSRVESIGGVTLDDLPKRANEIVMFSSTVWHHSSPLNAIAAMAPSAKVEFESGADVEAAARLAASADVAIVFAWQTREEGFDLLDLSLPANQDALIQRIAAANPRTVVVLQTGGSVLLPWASQAGAILAAWYPGNRGAEAIANILFGRVNPSGRLPISFPRAEADLPRPHAAKAQADMSKPGVPPATMPVVELTEGLAVGYRWYDSQQKAPAYEFGYGLSYTTFAYSNLTVAPDLSVTFDLANTGKRKGVEVVQLYLEFPASAGEPGKRLAGWARVNLAPGERRKVQIKPDSYALGIWDTSASQWRHPAGRYRVHVGASSRNLPLMREIDSAH